MKKLIIIIPLIMLISGCVVIEERYRTPGPRVVVESGRYYDYYPSHYYGFYADPFYYWMGASWWNPFWYYGFYNYYYGWYYPHYGSYYYYYPSRYYVRGSDVITKDQLKDPSKAGMSGRKIRYTERKSISSLSRGSSTRVIGSRRRSSGTRITGKVSRSGSSRGRSIGSTRSSSGSRSRSSGSTSKVKKKK